MTIVGSRALPSREPFAQSGLSGLLAAAALEAPEAPLLADDDEGLTTAETERRVAVAAGRLRGSGLVPGERLLVVGGAQIATLVGLAAVLRIGAEPVLAPCGAGPVELAACARVAGAVALIGPTRYGPLHLAETYLSAAAVADTIRLLATLGPETVDGALDLTNGPQLAANADGLPEHPTIATFESQRPHTSLVLHRQAALFADALALVEQARLNPSQRLMSTLPPVNMAALVAGPLTALVGAAGLVLHGPLDASRFLAACDASPQSALVIPHAMGELFQDAALGGTASTLILVSRFADEASFALPRPLHVSQAIVDLYAFGEDILFVRRRVDGEAVPPGRAIDRSLSGRLGARLNQAQMEPSARAAEHR